MTVNFNRAKVRILPIAKPDSLVRSFHLAPPKGDRSFLITFYRFAQAGSLSQRPVWPD
jgi:hypothetical protein